MAAGAFDGLYLRGTEGLVASDKRFFGVYRMYVDAVRPGGVVVADASREDMTWDMEDAFSSVHTTVRLNPGEQFGYAAKDATVKWKGWAAPPDHVTILGKA